MLDLNKVRAQIDEIDADLVALFEARMKLCGEVAEYKINTGKQVLDREREQAKLAAVQELAHSDFNKRGVEELFVQMMAISRKLQYQILAGHGIMERIPFMPVKKLPKITSHVVYQGVEGAYSHAAAIAFFGEETQLKPVGTFEDAMRAVADHEACYAVLPIENSSAGQVGDVYDLLMRYDNAIVGECYLKVEHALLSLPGASLDDIEVVYSHPQGLMQCVSYLNQHKDWQQISQANTAMSAQKVLRDGDKRCAAIASELAAKHYGLSILETGISDSRLNTTRFIIVTSKPIYIEGAKKVSICFEIEHESGSLYNILSHIIYNNLNMTKIESRPIKDQTFEYRFFVDFEGDLQDAAVINALQGIGQEAHHLKILGNY